MRIPKRFLIKGNVWTLEYVRKLTYYGKSTDGLTLPGIKHIKLRREVSKKRKLWVFWHEYYHAVLVESSVVENTGGIPDLAEEIICDMFADLMIDLNVPLPSEVKK
jgi:hypothetical protein